MLLNYTVIKGPIRRANITGAELPVQFHLRAGHIGGRSDRLGEGPRMERDLRAVARENQELG